MTFPPVEPLVIPGLGVRPTHCGGKATSLLEICQLVDVPEFIVIPPSWFTLTATPQLADIAACWSRWDTVHQKSIQSMRRLASVQFAAAMREQLTTQFGASMPETMFAVRSSAEGEDGSRRSFAGLHDTMLDVASGDLEQAVIAVWRSWFSVRALVHRGVETWQPPAMAVVVQRMVDADEAGVAAIYGGTIEVESVTGTGDRLVDGSVEPARRMFSVPVSDPRDSAERAAAVASVLRDRLGVADLEVEWAVDGDRAWVVQARSLTAQPPPVTGLRWAGSCTQPTLRSVELYLNTSPDQLVPLGPVAEVVGHYRTKRRPLYIVGSEHDCDLGTALVVHFNMVGLRSHRWAELVGQLGPDVVIDVSASERQILLATSDLRPYLADLCGSDPQVLRTVVVREFITGDCGALSTMAGADVRVEFSRNGLLGLNRGIAPTEEFVIPRDETYPDAPPGWSESTVRVIDRVTRQFTDRHGDAVVEWVLRAGRPVLMDYSLIDPGSTRLPPENGAMVISSGSCRGPAVVIHSSATPELTEDSVAPVVSVGTTLPPPSQTSVETVYDLITRLEIPPVVVVDRPYAVLATLIPYVAGFLFTQPAARLCHLAILLRENGIPAICLPTGAMVPEGGAFVEFGLDGRLHRGRAS